MEQFYQALVSRAKNEALPEEFNFFGKLIGSWNIDYIDNSNSRVMKGEWHFSWVLEGMAIQDVIVLPGFEYGTTLRVYKPDVQAWDVTYCYTGKIMRFEAAFSQTLRIKAENGFLLKLRTSFFIGRMLQLKRMASGLLISIYMPSAPDQYKCFDSLV